MQPLHVTYTSFLTFLTFISFPGSSALLEDLRLVLVVFGLMEGLACIELALLTLCCCVYCTLVFLRSMRLRLIF